MKVHIGGREILCDSCTETDGKYTFYQGGEAIMEIANTPFEIEAEGGEIEHIPNPLEQALEKWAEAAQEALEWRSEYNEVLADDEAKRARLERIQALVDSIGESPTLSNLITFLRNLKDILSENSNGSTNV